MAEKGQSPCPRSGLSKKEKGRFKKLWKRAAAVNCKTDLSGIQDGDDWRELQELQKEKSVGPLVSWRNEKIRDRVEGSDHRDILHSCMAFGSGSSRKRKTTDDAFSVTIPSWASLHNPVSTEHIGIVEVHLTEPNLLWEASLKNLIISTCAENNDRSVLQCETRWFQGPQPHSISRTLMHRSTDMDNGRKKQKKGGEDVPTAKDIYRELSALCMTCDALDSEGYPRADDNKSTSSETGEGNRLEGFERLMPKPSDILLEDAKEVTRDYSVSVVSVGTGSENGLRLPPFVQTTLQNSESQPPRVLAIDCEMVKTTFGTELARVTLVQLKSFSTGREIETELIWDECVKPSHPVVDYLTMYSGMTKAILDSAAVRLEQVQLALLSFIRKNDILIGHSLENDLQALRFVHSKVVDTAILLRPNGKRFKFSLRTLAIRLLNLRIQAPDRPHCSEEDAIAALKLACCRAVEGPSFCINNKTSTSRLCSMSEQGTTVCVGPSAWLSRHVTNQPNSIHALGCEKISDSNHKAVSSWLTGPSRRARLVWAHCILRDEGDKDTLKSMLKEIVAKLPQSALLMVSVQAGFEEAHRLGQHRRTRQNPKATVRWTDEEEKEWANAVEACRIGSTYWIGSNV